MVMSSTRARQAPRRFERSSIALSGCRLRGLSSLTANPPAFASVILPSRSADPRASAEVAPAASKMRTRSCSESASRSLVVIANTDAPSSSSTVDAKCLMSCVLPTPWTPSTSTRPPGGCPNRRTSSNIPEKSASSCSLPAKCKGGCRAVARAGGISSDCCICGRCTCQVANHTSSAWRP